ncbi:MAG: hypothetical protein ACRC62_31435, partial [Microcoleus sp.]
GLGIGCERGNYGGYVREWLYWYDAEGERYLTPQEQVKLEAQRALQAQQQAQISAQRAEQEAQRADRLAQKLRDLNIDPDSLDPSDRP